LSPSSINEFINCPAKWILKVSGYRDPYGSPAMWRGSAVDEAIGEALNNKSMNLSDVQDVAANVFHERNESAFNEGVEVKGDATKEVTTLSTYVRVAYEHYMTLGAVEDVQKKIEIYRSGCEVPIIGYADFVYQNTVRDLKTVSRSVTKIPDNHSRQMSVYATALNRQPKIDYVKVSKTSSEVIVGDVPNIDRHIYTVDRAILAMRKILAFSDFIEEIAGLMVPDLEDWRFSESEKKAAQRLWSLI
jgi:hypothetical protein